MYIYWVELYIRFLFLPYLFCFYFLLLSQFNTLEFQSQKKTSSWWILVLLIFTVVEALGFRVPLTESSHCVDYVPPQTLSHYHVVNVDLSKHGRVLSPRLKHKTCGVKTARRLRPDDRVGRAEEEEEEEDVEEEGPTVLHSCFNETLCISCNYCPIKNQR